MRVNPGVTRGRETRREILLTSTTGDTRKTTAKTGQERLTHRGETQTRTGGGAACLLSYAAVTAADETADRSFSAPAAQRRNSCSGVV